MNLLILDGPRDPRTVKTYRGTYRAHPTYCDSLPEDSETNVLFSWFLQEGGELGVVQDLPRALRFAELWNTWMLGDEHFEVVEVTDFDASPKTGGIFLGFDLSAGYNYSLLSYGLTFSRAMEGIAEPIRDLCDLLSRHYVPQLNAAGLFQTADAASRCLRSMVALQKLSPNLFESGDLNNFHVVSLQIAR